MKTAAAIDRNGKKYIISYREGNPDRFIKEKAEMFYKVKIVRVVK